MPPPLPLPVRVLVKGASTVNWTSWMGGPRDDLTFPRAIEAELLAGGRPARVETSSMTSERTATILSTWQREVLNLSPDVVVLVYGHYETIHLFLPRWLERHANSLKARPRRLTSLYRRRLQARLDTVLDPTVRRGRPRQVAADLEQYVTHVRTVGSPLVYVFELLPPTEKFRSWFPGMTRRIEVMNSTLSDLVERLDDDDVRYFRVAPLVDRVADGDLERAIPDGFHSSPAMHREIGVELAREIEAWARTQTHLADGANRAWAGPAAP